MKNVHIAGKTKGTWIAPTPDPINWYRVGPKKKQSIFAFGPKKMMSEHIFMKNREETTTRIHPDSAFYTMGGTHNY